MSWDFVVFLGKYLTIPIYQRREFEGWGAVDEVDSWLASQGKRGWW
jgi:hypothetical protein